MNRLPAFLPVYRETGKEGSHPYGFLPSPFVPIRARVRNDYRRQTNVIQPAGIGRKRVVRMRVGSTTGHVTSLSLTASARRCCHDCGLRVSFPVVLCRSYRSNRCVHISVSGWRVRFLSTLARRFVQCDRQTEDE
jgi:hypothetical protein